LRELNTNKKLLIRKPQPSRLLTLQLQMARKVSQTPNRKQNPPRVKKKIVARTRIKKKRKRKPLLLTKTVSRSNVPSQPICSITTSDVQFSEVNIQVSPSNQSCYYLSSELSLPDLSKLIGQEWAILTETQRKVS
jgi:hypothetical protein